MHQNKADETAEEAHAHLEEAEGEHIPHAHHGHHGGHGGHGGDNRVALLVTVIAALLAVTEISGKGAQTEALVANVQSNDQWSYYNAKDVRKTVVSTAGDMLEDLKVGTPPEVVTKLEARIVALRAEAAKYEDDPKPDGHGKKQIRAEAERFERERKAELNKYEIFEYASAAYELGIVLCSISMMLKARFLVGIGGALGVLGLALSLCGWFAPELIPLGGE